MSLNLAILLVTLISPSPPPAVRQRLQPPLTTVELQPLYDQLHTRGVTAKWITIEVFESFGQSGVVATVFPAPARTSSQLCRGEELTFSYYRNAWSFIASSNYLLRLTGGAHGCEEREVSTSRITLVGNLADAEIIAIIATIRKGRLMPHEPQTMILPDGSVVVIESCCRFPEVEKANIIGRVEVETAAAVRVSTSRRSGAGQKLQLRKVHGTWFITEVNDWVA